MSKAVRAIAIAGVAVAVIAAGASFASDRETQATRARSDHFWGLLAVNGSPMAHFDTLAAMAKEADIVVVGRIVRVTPGREVRDLGAEAEGSAREDASVYFADATLMVDEAIKGTPGDAVKLQLLLPYPDVLDMVQQDLPTERGIYFLRDMGAYFAAEYPESSLVSTLDGVFDFVSPQGLIRDLNGTVGVTADEGDEFLHAMTRRAFSDVLDEARQVAD